MIDDDKFVPGTPEPAPHDARYEDEDDEDDEDSVCEPDSPDPLNG